MLLVLGPVNYDLPWCASLLPCDRAVGGGGRELERATNAPLADGADHSETSAWAWRRCGHLIDP